MPGREEKKSMPQFGINVESLRTAAGWVCVDTSSFFGQMHTCGKQLAGAGDALCISTTEAESLPKHLREAEPIETAGTPPLHTLLSPWVSQANGCAEG